MLKDNADKISGDDKGKIESAVNGVKEALKGSDSAAIKSAAGLVDDHDVELWQLDRPVARFCARSKQVCKK